MAAVLAAAIRQRLGEDALDVQEVAAWRDHILVRVTTAAAKSSDLAGTVNALWNEAWFDRLYGPGLDAFALDAVASEVSAWLVEQEARRIVDGLDLEVEQ